MSGWRAVLVVIAVVACAGCQTPVVPDPEPEPTPYDVWTTPPPGEDAPRLTRVPQATSPRTLMPRGWSADAEIAFLNRYVWRGILVTDDPVFQPAANLSYGDFRLNIWANMDLGDANGKSGKFIEIDLALEWARDFERNVLVPFRLFAGAIGYFFPNLPFEPTAEVYAGGTLKVPLNPTITVYRDVVQVDGWYGTLHFEEGVDVGRGFSLHGKVGFGWGDRDYDRVYFGVPDNGLNDFHAILSVPYSRGRWTVKPFLGWHSIIDGTLRNAVRRDDNIVYGLSFAATL